MLADFTFESKKPEQNKQTNKIIVEQYISVAVGILLQGDYEDLSKHEGHMYYLRYCPAACCTPAAD